MKTISFVFLFALIFLVSTSTSIVAHEGAHGDQGNVDQFAIVFTHENLFTNDIQPVSVTIADPVTGEPIVGLHPVLTIDSHLADYSENVRMIERAPGEYIAKYSFQRDGDFDLYFQFNKDGEEFTKKGAVTVFAPPPGNEFWFLLIAGLLILGIFGMELKHKTHHFKRALVLSVIVLAATGLAYSVFLTFSSGAAAQGIVVCPSPNECLWTAHIHGQLEFDICGEDLRLENEKGPLTGPHTHEEKNLIHWHERVAFDQESNQILDTKPLQLGTFFDVMEVPFDSDTILDKKDGMICPDTGKPSYLKVLANGVEIENPREYVWNDGDVIRVIFDERPKGEASGVSETAAQFNAPSISLPIIVGLALIDAINPCVIGVLILLLTMLLRTKKKKNILIYGTVYTIGVYLTYFIGGVTLLSLFNSVREILIISQALYFILGAFIIIAGFLEIKDFFWYGRGFALAIPKSLVKHVEKGASTSTTGLFSAFFFGFIVTLIELPCTGAPYLAVLSLMSQSGMAYVSAVSLLLLYNLIFVLPLIIIIYIAYTGVGLKKMEGWRKEHRGLMRLVVGLALSGIGVWIIWSVADHLLLPLIGGIIAVILLMAFLRYVLHLWAD